VNLVVSGNSYALVWGGQVSPAWDINTTQNWTNQVNAADFFFDNDAVLFNDTSANPAVTLDVAAQPASVVFSNTVNNYTVSGTGKISGMGGLTKQGTGTVTMNTTNDFTGPVTLSAGLFVAGSDGALGSTNGGTTIASGATLDVQTNKFQGELVQVSGAGYDGQGAIINSDGVNTFGARNALRNVTLNGNTTFGGSGRWDIQGSGPTGSGSLIGPSYTVSKVGANAVVMTAGTDVNVAAIQVAEGSLVVETASTITNTTAITMSNNTALSFYRLYNPFAPNVTMLDQSTIRSTDASTNSQNQVNGQLNLVSGEVYVSASGVSLNSLKLAGRVTGGGTFVKIGSQPVELLNSSNNWTGGTIVSNGTLSVGNGVVNGSLPATPTVITNYANFMYNVASNTTVTTAHEITGSGAFYKRGDGILAMATSNSFTGKFYTGDGTPISGGIVRFLHPAAFGDPSLSKTVSVIRAELRLEGVAQLPSTVYLETSAFSDVTTAGAGLAAIRNVTGNNTVNGTVELIGGAGSSEYTVDSGLLTINGQMFTATNLSSRSAIFSGAANGIVNGTIYNIGTASTNFLSIEKRGSGTWTLNATNSYGGSTIVKGGTLLVQGIIAGSGVSVTNGTLGGNGVINASVVVSNVGTLSPGTSIGKLTMSSNLSLYASALMEVARNGAVLTNDQAAGIVTCTYGGELIVTNVGASALQAGDSFQLFAAGSYGGAFTNIVYPAGYNWTNTLATDGRVTVLSVIAPPPSDPPNFPPGGITRLPGGTILLVGTGAVSTPYSIWATTNITLRPITNTWTLLTNGVVTSSPFTNTDPAAASFPRRFYLFSTP
jgi:autotransporter-associated beta strand protein